MELYEYEKMYNFETGYWWFRGYRLHLKDILHDLGLDPKTCRVLDAGSGTGGNLELLKNEGYKNIFGFDLANEAVKFCRKRELFNVVIGDINNIPYRDGKFDIVLCLDVFECSEVDESAAYKELLSVLKHGGTLILIVAAFQFLLSEHDLAVHSVRRYNKKRALKSFSSVGIAIKQRYFFFFLFPFVAGYRILKNIFNKGRELNPQSDLKPLPKAVNDLLYFLVFVESKMGKFLSFPFGTTLVVSIKKSNKNDGILEVR